MTFPKLSMYDTAVYGSLAVAGTGAYLGFKHGPKDVEPGDRAKAGAVYGGVAAVGLAGAGLAAKAYGVKNLGKRAWDGVKSYKGNLDSLYRAQVDSKFSVATDAFKKARPKAKISLKRVNKMASAAERSSLGVYATVPVAMGAGAILGAAIAGDDHRTKGAVIGAGVGAVASIGMNVAKVWKSPAFNKMGLGKLGVFAGLSAMAFGAGEASYLNSHVQTAIIPDETGEQQYVDMETARQSGPGRRSRNLNANGGIVLGSHRGRHG